MLLFRVLLPDGGQPKAKIPNLSGVSTVSTAAAFYYLIIGANGMEFDRLAVIHRSTKNKCGPAF